MKIIEELKRRKKWKKKRIKEWREKKEHISFCYFSLFFFPHLLEYDYRNRALISNGHIN